MKIQQIFLAIIISCVASFSFAKNKTNLKQIAEKYIPSDFFQTRYNDSNSSDESFLSKEDVRISYEKIHFKNNKNQYIVAAYWISPSIDGGDEICKIKLIKIENGKDRLMPDIKLKAGNNLHGSCEISALDIDGDKIDELAVLVSGPRFPIGTIYFKLSYEELIDVTPINSNNQAGGSEFTNLIVSDIKIDNRPILIEKLNTSYERGPIHLTRIYIFKDEFVKIGSYAEYFLIKKEQLEKDYKVRDEANINYPAYADGIIQINWPKDDPDQAISLIGGIYELEIKNVSKHMHGVRAEIILNGVRVLKPEDFCKSEYDKNIKRNKKIKNNEHDDNDRCKSKKRVKTNVKMNDGVNTIKLKIFGEKDSFIQLTLNKKN